MKSLQEKRKPNIHKMNIVYRFVSLKSFPWIFYIFTENMKECYHVLNQIESLCSSQLQQTEISDSLIFSREMISQNKVIRKKVTMIV